VTDARLREPGETYEEAFKAAEGDSGLQQALSTEHIVELEAETAELRDQIDMLTSAGPSAAREGSEND
jgi:hypothetical protein